MEYESGMVDPHASEGGDTNVDGGEQANNKRAASNQCPHCKSVTHRRQTSRLCAMNPKNLMKENEYENAKLREGEYNISTL